MPDNQTSDVITELSLIRQSVGQLSVDMANVRRILIEGNGKEGLVTRVARTEEHMEAVSDRVDTMAKIMEAYHGPQAKQNELTRGALLKIATAIGALSAAISAAVAQLL